MEGFSSGQGLVVGLVKFRMLVFLLMLVRDSGVSSVARGGSGVAGTTMYNIPCTIGAIWGSNSNEQASFRCCLE